MFGLAGLDGYGVHEDGLVHISQISNRHIDHPLDVLSVGDIVDVTVLDVDKDKGRISLTMRDDSGKQDKAPYHEKSDRPKQNRGNKKPQKKQNGDRPKNKQRQNNRDVGTNLGSLLSGLKLN